MNTKKNIDKLYLQKFEGAEIAPPDDVWQNIASRLPENKHKRRLIPLWFRYGGVAAILLLVLLLGNEFLSPGTVHQISYDPVSRRDIHDQIRLSSSEFTETMLQVSMDLQKITKGHPSDTGSSSEGVGNSVVVTGLATGGSSGYTSEEASREQKAAIAEEFSDSEAAEALAEKEAFIRDEDFKDKPSPHIIGNISESAVAMQAEPQTEVQEESADVEASEDALALQLTEEFSTSRKDTEAGAKNKMSISTRVAPVFYEHLGRGNAVNASTAGGEASAEVSLSYGVNIAYQISDRVKIRSGINKLDLSHKTPGVPMASVMNSSFLPSDNDPSLMSRQVEGDLRQQMDFIEVPMEVEYRLVDRRIGLNLIAGGSTLFLNQNNLSMDTGVRTTDLGQAKDLENVNFSANMGLGLDYELAPDFRLSLEPMFKYQLNAEASGVRPHYMAIYSGFSISF